MKSFVKSAFESLRGIAGRRNATRKTNATTRRRFLTVETLEPRQLLTASLWTPPAMLPNDSETILIGQHQAAQPKTVAEGEAVKASVGNGVSETLLDSNQDWWITPLDVLIRVNWIDVHGAGPDDLYSHEGTWLDSNGRYGKPDGLVTPIDVLDVVRNLNQFGAHEIMTAIHGAVLEASVVGAFNPVGDTIGKGSAVEQLAVTVENVGDQVAVFSGVTVLHSGMGSSADTEVWLEASGRRVSPPRTFDQDQTATLRLNEPYVINPGEFGWFMVVVGYSDTAATGGEHVVMVELPSDMQGDFDSVSGAFPLKGDTFRVAAVKSGTVTVNNRSVPSDTVSVGMNQVVVGQFGVTVDQTEDQTLYSVQLKVDGPVDALGNISIRRTDGTRLTGQAGVQSDGYVQLYFDPPFTILEGDRVTLQVVADVLGGEGSTVTVGLEYGSDMNSVGSLFGYGVNGQTYGSPVLILGSPSVISIEEPTLYVMQKATTAMDTAVENQYIDLLRFEASAQGTLLTSVVVTANANVVNGQLWADTTGDGVTDAVIQDGVSVQGGLLSFTQFVGGGFALEGHVVFEVKARVASSLTADPTLQAGFATGTVFVTAERLEDGAPLVGISVDGSDANAQIQAFTGDATEWRFKPQGDAYFTVDSMPIRQQLMLGGTLAETVLRINVHAEYEPVDVTRLQISVMNGTAQSIDRLELYRAGGTTPFAVATVGTVGNDPTPPGYTTFQTNMYGQQLVVQNGEDVDILVRPRIKTDTDGGVSGEVDQFFVSANTCTVSARGLVSSNQLAPNNGDGVAQGEVFVGVSVAGPNRNIEIPRSHTVVMSKITSIVSADPNPNGTQVPTGTSDLGQFKVTAAANVNFHNGRDKVVLDGLSFVITTDNVEYLTAGIGVYNKADPTQVDTNVRLQTLDGTPITGSRVTGSFRVIVTTLLASPVNSTIDAGTDITLVLRMSVSNAKINPAKVSTEQTALELDRYFSWYDSDAGSSNRFDWVDLPITQVNGTSYIS